MKKRSTKKELPFFSLFNRFIQESKKGRRLQPNGKKIGDGTIKNYGYTLKTLEQFCAIKSFPLRIKQERYLNQRDAEKEKNYWKKFYTRFTDYLYKDCGYFDNYVGQHIKTLKTFFNYLNKDLALGVGIFHKQFYVRKEEIPIFPLMPEELSFLIYDQTFENSLCARLKEVKDVFVFGCTVALRVSDLLALKKSNLRLVSGHYYLAVRSQKTSTDTLIKLPGFAISILDKYMRKRKGLLPLFNRSNLNQYIKLLLEKAGFTHQVNIQREKRGKIIVKKRVTPEANWRFCDVASTHTMRRTAITTMLCLGMPEGVVRKISGHAPNTKEFYRYVLWAQTYQDHEMDKAFGLLQPKLIQNKNK